MTRDRYAEVLCAYEGVEELAGYSATQLRAYRDDLLDRTEQQASFIAARLPPGARVGGSRGEFARAWAADDGIAGVRFEVADALAGDLPGEFDAVICITGAFAYFDAMRAGSAAELLRRAHDALAPGGLLVLELYPHPQHRRMLESDSTGELRLWQELAPSDPWRFYLSHLRYDGQRRVLSHHKTFVHRTSGEIDEGRHEHLRLYDAAELEVELRAAGFAEMEAHGDWTGGPCGADDELLVVCGRRR